MRELPLLEDDGFVTPTVGDWAEDKYRLFWCYADMFATAMKDKWQHRVYVDLFAGSGRAHIRGTKRIIPAPSLLALDLKFPFTRYIFSEYQSSKLDALKQRVKLAAPTAEARFVLGDTNANITEIINHIPTPSKGSSVLTFCFADPYRLADLKFSTVSALSSARRTDFLVLVPSGMDANRNRMRYLSAKSDLLDMFLGNGTWRDRWPAAKRSGQRFAEFAVDEFGKAMSQAEYQYDGIGSAHPMISTVRKLPIYHLLMLSKHPLGGDFWEKCRSSSNPQRKLF